ncbi:DUF2157 domain-containing protein [Salibacteraceae bacterium]|nr:DUF2157 domain-containing protein [Salibacteraceae bacterium]
MPYEEQEWLNSGLITKDQFSIIDDVKEKRVFSIKRELQAMLYVGVLLLATGAGIIIYNHISSIGHVIAVGLIAAFSIVAFWYIFSRAASFQRGGSIDPNPYFSYITLLAALLTASLFTYLQLQFEFFGEHWSWLTLATAFLFGFMAYRFDHRGVLGLAITSLASFFGLRIEPQLFDPSIILDGLYYYNTGIFLAIALAGVGLSMQRIGVKKHFTSIYMQFSVLMAFLSAMAAMFDTGIISWYSLAALVFSALAMWYSFMVRSSWYMLYGVSVAYIVISAWVVYFFWEVVDGDPVLLLFLYFAGSPAAPLLLIFRTRNRFK